MYRHIKELKISRFKIEFQLNGENHPIVLNLCDSVFYTQEFFDDKKDIATDEDFIVRVYKNNMVIYNELEQLIVKIYMPLMVKRMIEKDINTKGSFSLQYRKHLYKEYSSDEHLFIMMNYIAQDSDVLLQAKDRIRLYSTGKDNQPILIVFNNEHTLQLHYTIVKNNIVVESGCLSYG